MHYFIDGYNFLFRVAKGKMTLQQRREILLKTLASLKLNITIVFDSTQERYGIEERGHWQDLEIVYTQVGQSADAYIKAALTVSSYPRRETVITSDRELTRLCNHLGAKTESIESFLEKIQKRKLKKALPKQVFKESDKQIERLIKIFESRLKSPDDP